MRHTVDVFGYGVLHRLMPVDVAQAGIRLVFVPVEGGAEQGALSSTKPCKVSAFGVLDDLNADTWFVVRSFMPTTAVLPTAPRPAWSFLLACLFASLSPDIRFVHFDRAGELCELLQERRADTVL